jgi:hypothetical protein
MFPLFHDRTRRLLCRMLFLLFGVLPTGAVLAWSAAINSEGYRTATCEEISAALGYQVRATSISHPRQEVTLLEGFELVDAETNKILLRSSRVEIYNDQQSQTIDLHRPELNIAGRNWWLPIIQRRLRLGNLKHPPLHLHASEITLTWPDGKQTLRDCTADVSSSAERNSAIAKFQFGDAPSAEPIQLQFRRTSDAGQPISKIDLITGSTALPCSLLAAAMDRENSFGTASTFRGTFRFHDGSDGYHAQVSDGFIEQVDLSTFVRRHFAGACSGTAQIQLQHAVFHDGQAEELKGSIHASSGSISGSALDAIGISLRLRPPQNWNTPAEVPFDQLAAEFTLTNTGLNITGRCNSPPEGVVLRTRNQPILWQPSATLPPWWLW